MRAATRLIVVTTLAANPLASRAQSQTAHVTLGAPEGSYQIRVADVGAEDWTAILDRVCHIPVFSLHFSHELSMSYQDSRPSLEKLAALLRARPDLRIEVQGHVDNVGTEKELVNLSTSRATIVNAALVALGVSRERITAKGYGKSTPVAPNDTDWGRTKNRRIEIAKKNCATPQATASGTSPRPGA